MKTINFKINNKIEFVFEQDGLSISLIQDIQDSYILITIPMKGTSRKLLSEGEKIHGIYTEEDNVFIFTTQVIERVFDNIPLYKLSIPKNYEKVQRRNFVRIPISIPLLYMRDISELSVKIEDYNLEEIEKSFEDVWLKGITLDLSGGGMKISIKRPLKTNEEIFVILNTEGLYIGVKCRIVRCIPIIMRNYISYHIGIEFIEIQESKRDKIIGFIFTKLREIRKKNNK